MNESPKKFPTLALALGFAPAALSLGVGATIGQNGLTNRVLWSICAVSVVGCFASSFMLIRRHTGWAIAGGLLFLLLNAAIAFCAGCVAVLQGMKF
jgi:hypothetical protein